MDWEYEDSGVLGRLVVRLIAVMVLGALGGSIQSVHAQGPTEYQVKAAFLSNFAHFVDWPSNAFPTEHAPITIGVLGDDPFGSALEEVVAGKLVDGRAFEIKRFRKVEDIKTCHILFISSSELKRLAVHFDDLSQRGILTVGDVDRFAEYGGVISLVLVGNHVRFEVNVWAADKAGLKISSKLLNLARAVVQWPRVEAG
ncbi:MAG: YfiR family protein [Candidatus Eisenbacteria sp.]|nr:YfiR family protein [Candidatus Eisenbacteria bacterium]